MTHTIKLHTAPGSLQRIHKGFREVDKAVAAMMNHALEIIDSPEFQQLTDDVIAARGRFGTVMAIELELEDHQGPEVFEVRV